MHIPRCQHVRVNGIQCGSPAIRGKRHCYFHSRHQLKPAHESAFDFPTLEDANAIQVALMQVIRAIADNKIECKRAGLLLYALQTAAYNLKHTKLEPHMADMVLDPSSLSQEVTPPEDPIDTIRAMRRTHSFLHDPAIINLDREIVARRCAQAVAATVQTPAPATRPAVVSSPDPQITRAADDTDLSAAEEENLVTKFLSLLAREAPDDTITPSPDHPMQR